MKRIETELDGVFIVEPAVYEDRRGYFFESYRRDRMAEFGADTCFVQDNQSCSARNTVRGLHYQLCHPQAKLCRVAQGAVLDVVVDIRKGSPTFKRWIKVRLSEQNRRQLFVPRGLAHGFAVVSETAVLLYKCDEYYHGDDEHGVQWCDPDLAIDWEVGTPLLSDKDRSLPRLVDVPAEHFPVYGPSS